MRPKRETAPWLEALPCNIYSPPPKTKNVYLSTNKLIPAPLPPIALGLSLLLNLLVFSSAVYKSTKIPKKRLTPFWPEGVIGEPTLESKILTKLPKDAAEQIRELDENVTSAKRTFSEISTRRCPAQTQRYRSEGNASGRAALEVRMVLLEAWNGALKVVRTKWHAGELDVPNLFTSKRLNDYPDSLPTFRETLQYSKHRPDRYRAGCKIPSYGRIKSIPMTGPISMASSPDIGHPSMRPWTFSRRRRRRIRNGLGKQ